MFTTTIRLSEIGCIFIGSPQLIEWSGEIKKPFAIVWISDLMELLNHMVIIGALVAVD